MDKKELLNTMRDKIDIWWQGIDFEDIALSIKDIALWIMVIIGILSILCFEAWISSDYSVFFGLLIVGIFTLLMTFIKTIIKLCLKLFLGIIKGIFFVIKWLLGYK